MKVKQILRAMGLSVVLMAAASLAPAQGRPGALRVDAVEGIVTVRGVNLETRVVTVENEDGKLTNMKVPPEAHNLDQVKPGDKFKVRYLQSVAIQVLTKGEGPSAGATRVVEGGPKGAKPGGAIVNTVQVKVKVVQINYGARTVMVRTPEGDLREFTVGPEVKRLKEVKVGDFVQVTFTEALALEMVDSQ